MSGTWGARAVAFCLLATCACGLLKRKEDEGASSAPSASVVATTTAPPIATTSATASATTAASATATHEAKDAPIAYGPYKNAAQCFHIDYPLGMVDKGASDIGDGKTWVSKEGSVTISAWAQEQIHNDQNLDAFFREETTDDPGHGKKVTLKIKKDTWFIVSGYEGTNIFYEKWIFAEGKFGAFKVSYPPSAKDWWNRATEHMEKSFGWGC